MYQYINGTYTAPANGWYAFQITSTTDTTHDASLLISKPDVGSVAIGSIRNGIYEFCVPLKKGTVVTTGTSANNAYYIIRSYLQV